MAALAPGLSHSLVPGHGVWATALEVGLFLALLLAVFGAVVVSEDDVEGRRRWAWTAVVLLVPIVGPIGYLVHRRRRDGDADH